MTQFEEIGSKWLRVEPWKRWCQRLLMRLAEGRSAQPEADEDGGESPAIEVLRFREKKSKGHFTSSSKPRDPRPPHVK